MKQESLVTPVVKWVGGKRQIMDDINKYIPKDFSCYYEPFLGGGAVLFEIQPKKAVVNDLNTELINLYKVIETNVEELINELKEYKNTSDFFYEIRSLDRDKKTYNNLTNIQKAARLHYLNKTCFNGLFRVNQQGEFNTPFGRYKSPDIVNEEKLRAVSRYFNKVNITFKNTDFEEAVKGIRKSAFVYFDPPYDPVSDSSNFTGYTKGGFNKEEQIRLKNLCDRLDKRGVRFLLSNSSTDFILYLYKDYNIKKVRAKRSINANARKRGEVDEILVMNYDEN